LYGQFYFGIIKVYLFIEYRTTDYTDFFADYHSSYICGHLSLNLCNPRLNEFIRAGVVKPEFYQGLRAYRYLFVISALNSTKTIAL